MDHAAGHAPEPELVSRAVQRSAGLLIAGVAFGAALGGIVALVFAFAYQRVGRFGPTGAGGAAGRCRLRRRGAGAATEVSGQPAVDRRAGNHRPAHRAVFRDDPDRAGRRWCWRVLLGRRLLARLGGWGALARRGGWHSSASSPRCNSRCPTSTRCRTVSRPTCCGASASPRWARSSCCGRHSARSSACWPRTARLCRLPRTRSGKPLKSVLVRPPATSSA